MLLGPWSIADLQTNIELLDVDIPAAVWNDLHTAGAMHTDAPVPG